MTGLGEVIPGREFLHFGNPHVHGLVHCLDFDTIIFPEICLEAEVFGGGPVPPSVFDNRLVVIVEFDFEYEEVLSVVRLGECFDFHSLADFFAFVSKREGKFGEGKGHFAADVFQVDVSVEAEDGLGGGPVFLVSSFELFGLGLVGLKDWVDNRVWSVSE